MGWESLSLHIEIDVEFIDIYGGFINILFILENLSIFMGDINIYIFMGDLWSFRLFSS